MMEGLTLLGPPNCPTSWQAFLVECLSVEPVNKATPVGLTTPVKRDTSVPSKGKLHPGSSGKKSAPPKQITDYWEDDERKKEDEESRRREEERCQKKPSGPVLSLDKHEELVMLLTSKAAPSRVSQGSRLPPCMPLPKARGAEAKFGKPVQSGSTPQKMSHYQTRLANRNPRVERRIILPRS